MAYQHQAAACESVMTCGVFAWQHSEEWLPPPYGGSVVLKKEFKDVKKAGKRKDKIPCL